MDPAASNSTALDAAYTLPVVWLKQDLVGRIEYNIAEKGPGENNTLTVRFPLDYLCPQTHSFGVLRCIAHQHIGALSWPSRHHSISL